MVKVMCGQRSRSRLTFKIQRSRLCSRSNPLVTFEAWGRYVCFSFRGNRTTLGWDIGNSIFDLEKSRSRSWPRSNLMVTFEALSSVDMFAFRFVAIGPFWTEILQILYLTLKIQGQGHGQGHTWWSHLSPRVQSICLLFVSWQSDHFWLRYSKFHIWPCKNLGQGHDENRAKSNQVIYRSGPTIVPKIKEIEPVFQKLSREQESAAGGGGGAGVRTSTKT